MRTSADLAQRQLEACNAHDIEAFMAGYAEDAQPAGLNGAVTQTGHDAIRARHLDLFTQHPQKRADLANRIDLGSTVIDPERGERMPGGERSEGVAIDTIRDGKIARVDFARGD